MAQVGVKASQRKALDAATSPSGINAFVTANESFNAFNVMAYGAVGDGTTDDTAAFQAAATAAIAAHGALIIPTPPTTYKVTSTITMAPPSGIGFSLDIIGCGRYDSITWAGGNDDTLFDVRGWKRSYCEGVNVRTSAATGLVVWDMAASDPYTSQAQITFRDCNVTGPGATGTTGWRLGHTDALSTDYSFIGWYNCHYSMDTVNTGQIGWLNEGSNALNNYWFGGSALHADIAVTNKATSGAVGNGGASMFFYGFGTSTCNIDYQFATTGNYSIVGGRYEVGKRFLSVEAGVSPVINVSGIELSGYTPSDNKVFYMGVAGILRVTGGYFANSSANYTNNFVYAESSSAFGTITFEDNYIRADDQFVTAGGTTWAMNLRGNWYIDANRAANGRKPDIQRKPTITITGDYTTVGRDGAVVHEINSASPVVVTVNTAFGSNGVELEFVRRGAGTVTFVGSGVTLRSPNGLTIANQYGTVRMRQRGSLGNSVSNEYILSGDLAP